MKLNVRLLNCFPPFSSFWAPGSTTSSGHCLRISKILCCSMSAKWNWRNNSFSEYILNMKLRASQTFITFTDESGKESKIRVSVNKQYHATDWHEERHSKFNYSMFLPPSNPRLCACVQQWDAHGPRFWKIHRKPNCCNRPRTANSWLPLCRQAMGENAMAQQEIDTS